MSRLKILYQQIADLTSPKCATECRIPQQCCAPEHCEATSQYAKEVYGIDLPITDHERLPFMGPTGCTVEPYLRPACAVHICDRQLYSDIPFSLKYYELREDIMEAELAREQQDRDCAE